MANADWIGVAVVAPAGSVKRFETGAAEDGHDDDDRCRVVANLCIGR